MIQEGQVQHERAIERGSSNQGEAEAKHQEIEGHRDQIEQPIPRYAGCCQEPRNQRKTRKQQKIKRVLVRHAAAHHQPEQNTIEYLYSSKGKEISHCQMSCKQNSEKIAQHKRDIGCAAGKCISSLK